MFAGGQCRSMDGGEVSLGWCRKRIWAEYSTIYVGRETRAATFSLHTPAAAAITADGLTHACTSFGLGQALRWLVGSQTLAAEGGVWLELDVGDSSIRSHPYHTPIRPSDTPATEPEPKPSHRPSATACLMCVQHAAPVATICLLP